MKKLNPDLLPPALALALFLGVWLIYALPLRAALSYEEQYQLFLSSWGYFAERMSVPGGLADYVSEWMTQWDHYPFAGAALVALTISGVQMMTWVVAKALGARAEHLALSLIPALLLWAYMGDADVLLSFGLSLVGALGLMLAYVKTPSPLWRCVLLVAGAPAGYWLLGPSAGVAVLFGVVVELLHGRSAARVAASVGAALWMALVVIGASYVVPYPLDRVAAGLNYHRFPEHILAPQLALMAVVALTPVAISLLRSAGRAAVVAEAGVVAVAGFFMLRMSFDQRTLDRLEYDYLVRTEQWDAIIAKARSRQPSTPTAVCAVNLALSQRGQLADRLFEFYQNGGSGLIPDFALNMQTPIASAEVFFRLGMINECERYMFEAQEAIPNYRKSGRLTRRIIECQITNGDYATARKLLHMMQKAPVYRRWACEQLTLIGNEKAVAAHPLYGRLRQLRQKMRDFL
ncbi:DUF6057 family protein, partial [Salmonella enterica]|nr:DUF6057 family protein [Salmonella enterica]